MRFMHLVHGVCVCMNMHSRCCRIFCFTLIKFFIAISFRFEQRTISEERARGEKESVRYRYCVVSHWFVKYTHRTDIVNEFVTWPFRCRTYTHSAFIFSLHLSRSFNRSNKIRVIRSVCKWVPALPFGVRFFVALFEETNQKKNGKRRDNNLK